MNLICFVRQSSASLNGVIQFNKKQNSGKVSQTSTSVSPVQLMIVVGFKLVIILSNSSVEVTSSLLREFVRKFGYFLL